MQWIIFDCKKLKPAWPEAGGRQHDIQCIRPSSILSSRTKRRAYASSKMSASDSASAAAPAPAPTAILRGRPAPKQPAPATLNHAMKNAKYYLDQHALYSLTAEEQAAVAAHEKELWAALDRASILFEPVKHSKKNPKYAELKAASAAASKAQADFRKLWVYPYDKYTRRYLQYYHGAPASKYVDGVLKHYMIWRYYVWELVDCDEIYSECETKPLGLLNPHAYFAARREGDANFLDFLDKTQPAPRLPREDWPLSFEHLHEFNNADIEKLATSDPATDDECAGCHICDPASPATAEKIPFPPNSVIVVKSTFRAHSSGSETYGTKVFSSYESASKYIIDQFREGGDALMYWDAGDCFEEEGDEVPMPEPTVAWACRQFNPAALKAFIDGSKWDNKLYGPYSEFCVHCPYELFVDLCEVL